MYFFSLFSYLLLLLTLYSSKFHVFYAFFGLFLLFLLISSWLESCCICISYIHCVKFLSFHFFYFQCFFYGNYFILLFYFYYIFYTTLTACLSLTVSPLCSSCSWHQEPIHSISHFSVKSKLKPIRGTVSDLESQWKMYHVCRGYSLCPTSDPAKDKKGHMQHYVLHINYKLWS